MGGLWSTLYCKKYEYRILIQGLDAAGKTTILYKLKLGEVVTTIPTIGFNIETLTYQNVRLTAWDLGGRDKARALFRHYYPNTHALVYVIDSKDRDRLDQAKDELNQVMSQDDLRDVKLVVLANKQDLDGALSPDEVAKELGLHSLRQDWGNITNSFSFWLKVMLIYRCQSHEAFEVQICYGDQQRFIQKFSQNFL